MEAVTLLRHFLNLIQALMLPLEVGRWDLAQPCQEALLAFGVIEKGCKSSVLHRGTNRVRRLLTVWRAVA